MSDLIGGHLPVPITDTDSSDNNPIQFSWCPGILLEAIIHGDWVLFDEMNLAPQPVLEGLNSLLDHRYVFILSLRN